MLRTIRHFQKATLIAVTIVIVISFSYYGQKSSPVGPQSCLVKVGDRCYRQKETQKLATHFDVALNLGMYDFAIPMMDGNMGERDPLNFVLNLIVLRNEAAKLGIEPSTEEIAKAKMKLPVFQQPWVDAAYIRNRVLGPNGFTDGDLAQLLKDFVCYQQLRELVGSGVQAVPSEVEKTYIRQNQRIDAFTILFDRKDYVEKVKVTDEEIKAFYEANKAEDKEADTEADVKTEVDQNLFSEEKRGFDYVQFTPATAPKNATNELLSQRSLAFTKAINRIYADLSEDGADFSAIAKKVIADNKPTSGMSIKFEKFAPFTADKAPDAIKEDEGQIASLFSATLNKGFVTVPFPQKDGSYIIYKLSERIEPQPLELKQATPAIKIALKNKKSNQLVSDAANTALAKLNDLLKAGKTIQAAAKETGVKLTKVPNFSESEPPADTPNASLIVAGAGGLGPKSLSKTIPLPNGLGFMLIYVDKVQIYKDENKDTAKRAIIATKEGNAKNALFSAWLKKKRIDEGAIKKSDVVPPENS